MYLSSRQLKEDTRSRLQQDRLGWVKLTLPMIVVNMFITSIRVYTAFRVIYRIFIEYSNGGLDLRSIVGVVATVTGVVIINYILGFVVILIELLQAPVARSRIQGLQVSYIDTIKGKKNWGYTIRLAVSMWLSTRVLPRIIPVLGRTVSMGLGLTYVSVPYIEKYQDDTKALNTLFDNFNYTRHYILTYIKLVYGYYLFDWVLVGLTFGLWGFVLYPKLLVSKALLFSEIEQALKES